MCSRRISLHNHFERTAELRGALFKNVNYGNRSHKEFGSLQCILQFTVTHNQAGMLIETLRGTFKCVQCTRDAIALMTDVSDNTAIAQDAHADSKLGCFLRHMQNRGVLPGLKDALFCICK